ncbi:MAG: 1,4-dihydroxy-2-naphthoate polyprenyltransferase [Deltaproteobacteria bacterium]|nr:1,4-dihydroxy-2-naphthoate polyprenyltransferase [Deltaproteobacteria bacterium]
MSAASPTPSTASAWLQATRPRTLTAAVGAVAVGSALAQSDHAHRPDVTLAALGVATSLQIASNLYNDYGDFVRGADAERIGPARAAQSGWLTPQHLRLGAFVAVAVATACGLHIVRLLGWPALVAGLAAILSAIAYTGGPAPLGYVGLGDAFVMLFFGVVAVNGTYAAHTGRLTTTSLVTSLAVGALATAILVVNNLRDRVGDAKVGKRTLVVRFGAGFGRGEYAALVALAYAVPIGLAVNERRANWLIAIATLPLAIARTRAVWSKDGAHLNPELGRTALLGLVYNLSLAAGALA